MQRSYLVGQMTFFCAGAYVLCKRLQFRGPRLVVLGLHRALMFPATVTVVPLWLMMAEAGLREHVRGRLVFRSCSSRRHGIFLLREYISHDPGDLINAGRRSTAPTLDVIVHVVVPATGRYW